MRATDRPRRRPDVETYVIPDGSSMLFDPVAEAGYPLDLLRSLIWDYCDGKRTGEEIAAEVATLLPDDASAHDHALLVVGELAERGLLLAS